MTHPYHEDYVVLLGQLSGLTQGTSSVTLGIEYYMRIHLHLDGVRLHGSISFSRNTRGSQQA